MMVKGIAGDVMQTITAWVDGRDREEVLVEFAKLVRRPGASSAATIVMKIPRQQQLPRLQAASQQPRSSSASRSAGGEDADAIPCICAGVSKVPCSSVDCCGPASACVASGCCVPGRGAYHDVLTRLLGDVSFGEALWLLVAPPLSFLLVFCVPLLNFALIGAFYLSTGRNGRESKAEEEAADTKRGSNTFYPAGAAGGKDSSSCLDATAAPADGCQPKEKASFPAPDVRERAGQQEAALQMGSSNRVYPLIPPEPAPPLERGAGGAGGA